MKYNLIILIYIFYCINNNLNIVQRRQRWTVQTLKWIDKKFRHIHTMRTRSKTPATAIQVISTNFSTHIRIYKQTDIRKYLSEIMVCNNCLWEGCALILTFAGDKMQLTVLSTGNPNDHSSYYLYHLGLRLCCRRHCRRLHVYAQMWLQSRVEGTWGRHNTGRMLQLVCPARRLCFRCFWRGKLLVQNGGASQGWMPDKLKSYCRVQPQEHQARSTPTTPASHLAAVTSSQVPKRCQAGAGVYFDGSVQHARRRPKICTLTSWLFLDKLFWRRVVTCLLLLGGLACVDLISLAFLGTRERDAWVCCEDRGQVPLPLRQCLPNLDHQVTSTNARARAHAHIHTCAHRVDLLISYWLLVTF